MSDTTKLYPAEMQVLCLIINNESTVTDIAATLSITKSAASQLVKRLCSKNMLEKHREEENERTVLLSCTDNGRSAVNDFFNNQTQAFGEMVQAFSTVSSAEMDTIRVFLNRLEIMLDKKLQ